MFSADILPLSRVQVILLNEKARFDRNNIHGDLVEQ